MKPASPVKPEDEEGIPLDAAIRESAEYFTSRLPRDRKIAILSIDADTEALSDYLLQELWNHFERAAGFTMIERQNLSLIQRELIFQNSGEISDESRQALGKMLGAETLVYGKLTALGETYRLVLYATDVEQAVSRQQVKT
ncbi:MAG: CsgG/HfaB family protein, partial [Spirochaetia bacterium]|nr:CsgG/HfaB family protein [Spirochaetia bacterium]